MSIARPVCPDHGTVLLLESLPYRAETHQHGLKCPTDGNYFCFDGAEFRELIACAVGSTKVAPYFRTKGGNEDGVWNAISPEHLHAQYLLETFIRRHKRFEVYMYVCNRYHPLHTVWDWTRRDIEVFQEFAPHAGAIGDLIVRDQSDGSILLCIEVKVSHWTETSRRCDWVEVEASEVIQRAERCPDRPLVADDIRHLNPHPECRRQSQRCSRCIKEDKEREAAEEAREAARVAVEAAREAVLQELCQREAELLAEWEKRWLVKGAMHAYRKQIAEEWAATLIMDPENQECGGCGCTSATTSRFQCCFNHRQHHSLCETCVEDVKTAFVQLDRGLPPMKPTFPESEGWKNYREKLFTWSVVEVAPCRFCKRAILERQEREWKWQAERDRDLHEKRKAEQVLAEKMWDNDDMERQCKNRWMIWESRIYYRQPVCAGGEMCGMCNQGGTVRKLPCDHYLCVPCLNRKRSEYLSTRSVTLKESFCPICE